MQKPSTPTRSLALCAAGFAALLCAGAPAPAPAAEPASVVERAWFESAGSPFERLEAIRRNALEVGIWSFDAGGRALLSGGFPNADPLTLARGAVRLAPDLPAARMELARTLWMQGDAPLAAGVEAGRALFAALRHPEAAVWLGGSALFALALALVAAGLLSIAVGAAFAALHASHDLGDAVPGDLPGPARFALLASALLLPLCAGEGLYGLALALMALGCVYGRGRAVLGLAGLCVWLGAHPLADRAGAVLATPLADPVGVAAVSTAQGFSHAADLVRLREAESADVLAAQALALRARRQGSLAEADSRYQALLARAPGEASVANNAANVRLALGHLESALALYDRAAQPAPSAVGLYNRAQAHGNAFQVDELSEVLARAQGLDRELVAELTALQGTEAEGFVVDLPLARSALLRRNLVSDTGRQIGRALREPLAPGRVGREPVPALVLLLVLFAGSCLASRRVRPSQWCEHCGRRVCPRCDHSSDAVCDPCQRLFRQTANTHRALRLQRIQALQRRQARIARLGWLASLLVPGAAGQLAGCPVRGAIGAFGFALAGVALYWRHGVVPDPGLGGGVAGLAFLCVAALGAITWALALASTLRRVRA